MAKTAKTDPDLAAVISKTLASGIVVNSPSTGYIRVPLTSLDTSVAVGSYFIGLQIEFPGNIQEVVLSDGVLTVVQDVIAA